jgi:hypothetical protein
MEYERRYFMKALNLEDLIWGNENEASIPGLPDPMLNQECILAGCIIVGGNPHRPTPYNGGAYSAEEFCGC